MSGRTGRPAARVAAICVAAACLLGSSWSSAAPGAARFHRPPALGDEYLHWTMQSLARLDGQALANFAPFQSDARWRAEYQSDTASIYSDLHPRLFGSEELSSGVGATFPDSRAKARIIAWDLGLDKALPGYQVIPTWPGPTRGNLLVEIAANLEKADVLPEYYKLAYQYGGSSVSTLNAELAVALQILHEWVEATSWRDRDSLGIDEGVLTRFRERAATQDVSDQDLEYLADLLRSELSTWRAGRESSLAQREVSTPLRIARVAAAYKVSQMKNYNACFPDGTHDPATAGTVPEDLNRTICYTDATDRAVYRWYRAERAEQLARFHGDLPLVAHFDHLRPAWAAAFNDRALDWSNHAEIVEVQMAIRGAHGSGRDDTSILRLIERANLTMCKDARQ